MESLSAVNVRAIIFYLWKKGYTQVKAYKEMNEVLGSSAPSYDIVHKWFNKFSKGIESLKDAPREGRPMTQTTPEKANAVEQLVKENPSISSEEIGQLLGIGKSTALSILNRELGLSKVNVHWVPHALTDQQKSARVDFCLYFLNRFKKSNHTSLYNIVTGDETYLYYYDPLDSKQAQQWHPKGAPPPKKAKRSLSMKKVLVSTFFP
jgi:[histone H3]-lysine36 N-dimethyltransferase SETMAR